MILRLIPKEALVVILVMLTGFCAIQKMRLVSETGRANDAERAVIEIEIGLRLQTDKANKKVDALQKEFKVAESKSKREIKKWKKEYERDLKNVYENPDAVDDLQRPIQPDIVELLCDRFNTNPDSCSTPDN